MLQNLVQLKRVKLCALSVCCLLLCRISPLGIKSYVTTLCCITLDPFVTFCVFLSVCGVAWLCIMLSVQFCALCHRIVCFGFVSIVLCFHLLFIYFPSYLAWSGQSAYCHPTVCRICLPCNCTTGVCVNMMRTYAMASHSNLIILCRTVSQRRRPTNPVELPN